MAKKIANELSNRNIYIVSGLARGIDTCAHIGAIKEKAKTIAVLGNGLDSIYPSENKKLSEIIIDKGGLILSEYIIGTKPEKKKLVIRQDDKTSRPKTPKIAGSPLLLPDDGI